MRFIYRGFFSLFIASVSVGLAGAQAVKYTVQLEAASTKEAADEKVKQFEAQNVQAYIVKSFVLGKGTFYRVRVGIFPNQNEARKFGADLQRRGVVSDFFIAPYEKPTDDVVATAPPANPAPKEQPVKGVVKQQPVVTPNNSQIASNNTPAAPANPAANPPTTPATNPQLNAGVGSVPTTSAPAAAAPPSGFAKFQDPKIGYSFDYPNYWMGQPLSSKEATDQRMNAGALFQSQEDAAFLNAVWNELDKANNPSNDNDLIVEVILKSMQSSDGTKLQETARQVKTENGLIKTYLDLKAAFQTQGQTTPLDFLGKAVIIRAAKGILLVVTFYSKDAPPNTASLAERIIASARAPE